MLQSPIDVSNSILDSSIRTTKKYRNIHRDFHQNKSIVDIMRFYFSIK